MRTPLECAAGESSLKQELTALFPTPGRIERVWLCRALALVLADVPWLTPWFTNPSLPHDLEALEKAELEATPVAQRNAGIRRMVGDHGIAGAIIGTGSPLQPRGLQTFRGLLWLTMRHHWQRGTPFFAAAQDLAGPIRAAARSFRSTAAIALTEPLAQLGEARTLSAAVAALQLVESTDHKGLVAAWLHWLQPTLESLIESPPEQPTTPTEILAPSERNPDKPRRAKRPRQASSEDRRVDSSKPIVFPLGRTEPGPDQLPDEPPSEISSPDSVVFVPGYGTGKLSRRRAEFRANQAIWGGNHLLLPIHPDALPADVYGAALRSMTGQLLNISADDPLARGLSGCLLKSISGRTTPGLAALHVGKPPEQGALDRWHLDLDAGLLITPPFWKLDAMRAMKGEAAPRAAGHFRPTPEQRAFLVPVTDKILLPLVRPLRRALEKHRASIATLADFTTIHGLSALDAEMATAARWIAQDIGAPIQLAGLRRSLAPLVADLNGDAAMAQLICCDSLGLPTAHQNYFAPRRGDLAATYVAVTGHCFDDRDSPRIPEPGLRVGSELLVTPGAAKRLALASSQRTPDADVEPYDPPTLQQHRRILDHLVRMMLAVCGHRPAEALFELTLGDIDLATGAALFADKRIDVAHDPRLACLPTLVCRQIPIYLDHLATLPGAIPSLADDVESVLAGRAPLLVDFDEQGRQVRPTIAAMTKRGPKLWRELPLNWGRTYLRTRGVELGGSAFLMACQLGHFDAVGYPYANQSPTDPLAVIEATRPVLDRILVSQGWKVIQPDIRAGAPASRRANPILPPLQDWTARVADSDQRAAASDARWQRSLRIDARKLRQASVSEVLGHKDLIAHGVSSAFEAPDDTPTHASLNQLDFPRIRQELILASGDDAPAAVSRLRALRTIISRVARRQGEHAPPLPIPIAVRRPLDNPFFRGACLPLTQLEALRRHVQQRASWKSPSRDIVSQTARAAESLCLFGGIDDPAMILELIGARTRAIASASIPDLLLVPVSDGRVIALRGIAALCMAASSRLFPDAPLPGLEQIDLALAGLLPDWAKRGTPDGHGTLALLCSTVRVTNRFELSPAARLSLDSDRGCVPASLAEQIAYIDQDPTGPRREERSGANSEPTATTRPRPSLTLSGRSALAQYQSLVAIIPTPKRSLHLPIIGLTIPPTELDLNTSRSAVIRELDRLIENQASGETLKPIVHMLAAWIRQELSRVKADGDLLANRSISTYLTRIGRSLTEALGDSDISRWDGTELEEAYTEALATSTEAKHKVAAQLLSFHTFCEHTYDLPEVDLAAVYAEIRQKERGVDARMILPVERRAAVADLARQAHSETSTNFEATRVSRIADFTMLFLAQGGARISEALGLQLRDLGVRPNRRLWAWLRPNRLRGMKTFAGRRVLQFDHAVDPAHHDRALQWIEGVRRCTGSRRVGATYVTQDSKARAFDDHPAVTRQIRAALARATGRGSERLHRLRHLSATDRIARTVLDKGDADWAGIEVSPHLAARPLEPRDLHAISIPLGHSHWVTTLSCYLHLPWLLQSRSAARVRRRYFSRQAVAGALGYTPSALDELLRGTQVKDPLNTWFDHFRVRRCVIRNDEQALPPSLLAADEAPENPTPIQWTARRVGDLIDQAWRARDLLAALVFVGAPLSEAARIEKIAARWETKLGLRLLPEFVGERRRICPARAIRRLADDSAIETLWTRFDEGDNTVRALLHDIAGDCFTYLSADRDHRLRLTAEHVAPLCRLLKEAGVSEPSLSVEELPGDLVSLIIQRAGRQNPGRKGLGLKRVLAVLGLADALAREAT